MSADRPRLKAGERLNLKAGDRAMIVNNSSIAGLYVDAVTVRLVTKTGLIKLEDRNEQFNARGQRTGKHSGFRAPPRLQEWDDGLWQEYQRQRSNNAMASKLFRLGELFQRKRGEAAAEIWEKLPFEVRQLVEKNDER